MLKKIITYRLILFIVLYILSLIIFGSLLRHHYLAGKSQDIKFSSLQKIIVFIAEIPSNIKFIILNENVDGDIILPIDCASTRKKENCNNFHENKKFFDKKLDAPPQVNLILVSRHDGDLGRSIVEIRDLNTFEVLHTYLPDIEKIYEKIDHSKEEFNDLKKFLGVNRFYMMHPLITSKGELIFHSSSPLIKIDFKSNIMWINSEDNFHHSNNLDEEGNIYVPSFKRPISKVVNKYVDNSLNEIGVTDLFTDDTINILNQNGEIFFSKSVSEILIEHGYVNKIFSQAKYKNNPIHLNDIQPVLKDTPYFKKGDLFLSLRNLSMIILYRPSSNKIIRIIEGSFFNQHDVDILDDKRISIYNNNVFHNHKNDRKVTNNEIVIYNFETNNFSKIFEKTFIDNKINTDEHGLVDFLTDGSAIVEDRNNARIFFLNSNGDIIWKFNNLNSKKQLYDLWWTRVIDTKKSIVLRNLIKNKND